MTISCGLNHIFRRRCVAAGRTGQPPSRAEHGYRHAGARPGRGARRGRTWSAGLPPRPARPIGGRPGPASSPAHQPRRGRPWTRRRSAPTRHSPGPAPRWAARPSRPSTCSPRPGRCRCRGSRRSTRSSDGSGSGTATKIRGPNCPDKSRCATPVTEAHEPGVGRRAWSLDVEAARPVRANDGLRPRVVSSRLVSPRGLVRPRGGRRPRRSRGRSGWRSPR